MSADSKPRSISPLVIAFTRRAFVSRTIHDVFDFFAAEDVLSKALGRYTTRRHHQRLPKYGFEETGISLNR
jgi:hypothetical protein